MRYHLILIFFLLAVSSIASADIRVTGANVTFNPTLIPFSVPTVSQPVTSIFIFNDNGNTNQSLEAIQIPTNPEALIQIFTSNEAASGSWALERGIVPTKPQSLEQIFALHEFVKDQKDLAYPMILMNDTVPPKITSVTFDNVKPNEARINWTTDEFANSLVKYGLSPGSHEYIKEDHMYTENHSISINDLTNGTEYYFVVNSTDQSGNSAESQAFNFLTLKA